MSVDKYIILSFAVIYAAIMLAVKDILVKYLASLYSVSLMLLYTSFQLEGKLHQVHVYAIRTAGFLFLGYTFLENSKLIRMLRKLESKAYKDSLTGVYNRKFLEEVFKLEIEKYKKFRKSFCILFLDLNNFKMVNDTYGHIEGDKLLQKVAQIIKSSVRKDDFVIRYGGDEFVIVTDIEPNYILKLVERLNNDIRLKYNDIEISVSIGSACYPTDGKDLDTLLKTADMRMYRIKKMQKDLLEPNKRE